MKNKRGKDELQPWPSFKHILFKARGIKSYTASAG